MRAGWKYIRIFLVIIVIGLIGGVAGILYMQKYGKKLTLRAKTEDKKEGKKDKKILYWKAPMNPSYISDRPGKSPMGMDLIPVYEGEGATEPGTVRINPVTIQNIGVKKDKVRRVDLERKIRTIGRIDYDERKVYHIHTKIEGWVEKLYIDFTGQEVKKDNILIKIYSPELVSTQEEYLLAYKAAKKTSGSQFKEISEGMDSLIRAARERLKYWDITDDQIKRLEETGRITKTMDLHSPKRGVVIKKHVQEGMFVKPGMNLYTIADISRVWAYADIYEYEMPWIRLGQKAEMTLASYPGRVFKGRVSFIYPFVEKKTRTVKVRLEFDNPGWLLKPDMYANVTLESKIGNVVAVPKESVLLSGERSVVIIARGEGKFTPKEVKLGAEAENYYEVLDGVKEGDEVVTSAHFLIDSESRLKEAVSKMLESKKGEMDKGKGEKSRDKTVNTNREGMDKKDKTMEHDLEIH